MDMLKDRLGNPIGSIETRPDGVQVGRHRLGHLRGTFDPRTNQTRDRLNNPVGYGNLLAHLILQD